MHGMIFAELKKYVTVKLGDDAWPKLLQAAGLPSQIYVPVKEYPDSEIATLVTTASKLTGAPAAAILEDFGAFIVPGLVGMYKPLIRPEWTALDVIQHTEATIHKAVRANNAGAKPPELKTRRVNQKELVLTYTSARKMCSVAKGIAKGVAKYYNEPLRVTETQCMHTGAPSCEIVCKSAA